jgi:hypothetical protein
MRAKQQQTPECACACAMALPTDLFQQPIAMVDEAAF